MIPTPPPAIISQAFGDRAARLQARIVDDAAHSLLARGQETLLRVQLDAATRANAAQDPIAGAMLDVIDRQLAAVDFTLSSAEDGTSVVVHAGDTVTIAMHDPYFWTFDVSDTSALALHRGVMWARGVQGAFAAQKPGIVTVILTSKRTDVPQPRPTVKQPVVFTVIILPKA